MATVYDDLLVSAHNADIGSELDAGKVYVIFGGIGGFSSVINVSTLDGTDGFVLLGENANDETGRSAIGAGDVNGDGFDDIAIGAAGFYTDAGDNTGSTYIFFGGDFRGEVDLLGTSGDDVLNGSIFDKVIIGGAGNDTLTSTASTGAVLQGGAGDDILKVNNSNFTRIDGGTGDDTLLLFAGVNMTGFKPEKIQSIERIDMGSGGAGDAFTLILDEQFVRQVTDSPDPESNTVNTLVVDGDSSDSVVLSDFANWTSAAIIGYTAYTHNVTGAVVNIEDTITNVS